MQAETHFKLTLFRDLLDHEIQFSLLDSTKMLSVRIKANSPPCSFPQVLHSYFDFTDVKPEVQGN